MAKAFSFFVRAVPAPKGSMSVFKGRAVHTAKSRAFEKAIVEQAPDIDEPMDGPIDVEMMFYLERPKSAKRAYPHVAPDLDKLQRSVGDGLEKANIVVDDSRIVNIKAGKRYVSVGQTPGVQISICPSSIS